MPGIIKLLEYCPYHPCPTFAERVTTWRKMVQVDESTVAKFEAGKQMGELFYVLLRQEFIARGLSWAS